jgi:hypothetical protein
MRDLLTRRRHLRDGPDPRKPCLKRVPQQGQILRLGTHGGVRSGRYLKSCVDCLTSNDEWLRYWIRVCCSCMASTSARSRSGSGRTAAACRDRPCHAGEGYQRNRAVGRGRARRPRETPCLEDHVKRHVLSIRHISCTCRMGREDDPMAVTAPDGRVHGLGGLRVADPRCSPRSRAPTLTFRRSWRRRRSATRSYRHSRPGDIAAQCSYFESGPTAVMPKCDLSG